MFNKKEWSRKYYKNNKQHYIKNKEEKKKYDKQYYIKNKEKKNELSKQWYINNIEKKKEYDRQYNIDNKEKHMEQMRCWVINNKEKVKKYRKQWRENNPEYILEYMKKYMKNRSKTDLKFNLNLRMRTAIWKSLKGNKNGRHWEDLVGYNIKQLEKRLKLTMPKDYNWNDFIKSNKLEIDHIYPIAIFNFTKPSDYDFQRCWSLKNLRLLPKRENRVKRDKLIKPLQLCFKI